jgi:hypothetical protein
MENFKDPGSQSLALTGVLGVKRLSTPHKLFPCVLQCRVNKKDLLWMKKKVQWVTFCHSL